MKKLTLILAVLITTICISQLTVSAEIITSQNINTIRSKLEAQLNNGTSLSSYSINSLIADARRTDSTVIASDKASLDNIVKRAVNLAMESGDRCYKNGDNTNAKAYYQIVISNKKHVSSSNLVKVKLNLADLFIKQGRDGCGNVCDAINLEPSNASVATFIDQYIKSFDYSSLMNISRTYANKKQYAAALKYYAEAEKLANGDSQKATVKNEIAKCKEKQNGGTVQKQTVQRTAPSNTAASQNDIQAKKFLQTAVRKYNYKDYSGGLKDLEEVNKLVPDAYAYYVLYPVFAISLNNPQSAIQKLDKIIEQNSGGFKKGNANYSIALEFRGSLKLLLKDYNGAISDFNTALTYSFDEYNSIYKGLIISNLVKGDINNAKTVIAEQNRKSSYYSFADCSTYADKIILNLGYGQDKVVYNSNLNSKLIQIMVAESLKDYAYTVSKLYSNLWGGIYIEIQ